MLGVNKAELHFYPKPLLDHSCSRKQGLKICLPQKNLKYHHFEIGDSEESCKGEWQQHKRCLQRYFGKTGGGDAFVNSFLRMYLMSSLGEDIYLILFEVKISSFRFCPFGFIEVRSTVALNIL